MWIIGEGIIVVIVLLPKILELLIGSGGPDYGETNSEHEQGSG